MVSGRYNVELSSAKTTRLFTYTCCGAYQGRKEVKKVTERHRVTLSSDVPLQQPIGTICPDCYKQAMGQNPSSSRRFIPVAKAGKLRTDEELREELTDYLSEIQLED